MPSLIDNVNFSSETAQAITLLLHTYDFVLFSHDFVGDSEVWARTLHTLKSALFDVRMAGILALPGMGAR